MPSSPECPGSMLLVFCCPVMNRYSEIPVTTCGIIIAKFWGIPMEVPTQVMYGYALDPGTLVKPQNSW